MKKLIYIIPICIIIIGIIIIATIGFKVDLIYGESTRLNIYIGKDFNLEQIRQITNEIWKGEKVILQKYRTFEDVASITVKDATDEQLETLNQKLNDTFELENEKESIAVTKQPRVRLISLIQPYIVPYLIVTSLVIVYMIIRYKKLGILKTMGKTICALLLVEGTLLGVCAIARIPINRLIIPIGLMAYIIVISILSMRWEGKREGQILE